MSRKDKKSILFINHHLRVGGVEKALLDLLSVLDDGTYDIDLFLLQGGGEWENRVPKGVRLLEMDTTLIEGPFKKTIWTIIKAGRLKLCWWRLIDQIANRFGKHFLFLLRPILPIKKRYDFVIAFRHDIVADIAAYVVKGDKKFGWWHHGEISLPDGMIRSILEAWIHFDKIITVSKGCKEMLIREFNLSHDKVLVLPNIVNPATIQSFAENPDQKDWTALNSFTESKGLKIITLTRFAPEKHLEEAVEAASLLKDKLNFVWYMIGDGSEFERINAQVDEKNLSGRVVLTGSLSNPYPFLKCADMMVHTSHVESLCLSVLEAMSLRIPCVAVRSIGPESFIISGENGLLVEKGPESIADGILQLVGMSHEQREEFCLNAYKTVKECFSPPVVRASFERLIINAE